VVGTAIGIAVGYGYATKDHKTEMNEYLH
jgi:hypothetical protein